MAKKAKSAMKVRAKRSGTKVISLLPRRRATRDRVVIKTRDANCTFPIELPAGANLGKAVHRRTTPKGLVFFVPVINPDGDEISTQ